MIIARNILLIFLALLFQASWGGALAIYGIVPDLVIITLVFIAISRGQIEGTVLGFASGLLIDLYDPGVRLGINALGNSLIGFGVGYSRLGIVAESLRVQAVILFFCHAFARCHFFSVFFRPDQNFEHRVGHQLLHRRAGHGIVVCLCPRDWNGTPCTATLTTACENATRTS